MRGIAEAGRHRADFRSAHGASKIATAAVPARESEMDPIALSLKMKRLVRWLDDRCQDNLVRRQFDGPPFGRCYVTIDPERQGNVASINLNRVYLWGNEAGLDVGSFAQFIDLFAASGV